MSAEGECPKTLVWVAPATAGLTVPAVIADAGEPPVSVIVAAYVEQLGRSKSAPTAKQALAAHRMLFDWMVVGQVLPMHPASSVPVGRSTSSSAGRPPF